MAAVDDDEQIIFAKAESGTATGRGSIFKCDHPTVVGFVYTAFIEGIFPVFVTKRNKKVLI